MRTLLVDGDLRNPRHATLFKLEGRGGLANLLVGRGRREAIVRIPGLSELSVLPAGVSPPNPQELLDRPAFGELIAEYSESYDFVIVDTPAGNDYADAQIVAARSEGALIVARTHVTPAAHLARLADALRQANTTIVGSVLNDP